METVRDFVFTAAAVAVGVFFGLLSYYVTLTVLQRLLQGLIYG